MTAPASAVRDTITRTFTEVFEETSDVAVPPLTDDLVLLESGLDSLAFAVVVTRLEEELGYDPFMESPEPYYPQTLGEFIEFYERHSAT
jgi:acyl carrier protein